MWLWRRDLKKGYAHSCTFCGGDLPDRVFRTDSGRVFCKETCADDEAESRFARNRAMGERQ